MSQFDAKPARESMEIGQIDGRKTKLSAENSGRKAAFFAGDFSGIIEHFVAQIKR
jgi:hypothetical protein